MPVYEWADDLGNIVEENYNEARDKVTPEEAKEQLIAAFEMFGSQVDCVSRTDVNYVYDITVTSPQGDIENYIVCVREMTPGGRSGLKNEQRIQPESRQINAVYDEIQSGNNAVLLGVYKRHEEVIFCAWKANKSNASNPSTGISKQIKIATIADSIKTGFTQQRRGRGEFACAFRKEFIYFYINNSSWIHSKLLEDMNEVMEEEIFASSFNFNTNLESEFYRNRIIFGAPGTGKSFFLNSDRESLLKDGGVFERITFHPDYSYANFVGTYKPVPDENGITYKFVPGPFMRVYVKALKNGRTNNIKPHLLIIEEINRANAAAVFGEIFQLLDRDSSNVSEYSVQPSEDIKKYLADELEEKLEDISTLKIPDNMFIWATMNSADQGVFPLDTAFKRRWDFDYLGINNNESDIKGYTVYLGKGEYTRPVEWNELRKSINNALSSYKINEDKLLGPYFLARKIVVPNEGNDIDAEKFISAFKSKVLMYLFEDAAKQRRTSLFDGCSDTTKYSSICKEFDLRGVEIFCKSIRDKFPRSVSMVAESPGEYE